MRHLWRWTAILFFIVGILVASSRPAEASASLPVYQDPSNPNIYYTVGLYYTAIWKHNDGEWQNGLKKDMYVGRQNMDYTYDFNFPNRKIKEITVSMFDHTMANGGDIFKTSRGGIEWGSYRKAVTTKSYTPKVVGSPLGLGTSSASVTAQTDGWLTADTPVDLTLDENGNRRPELLEGVEGYHYYFPVLFTVELEPLNREAKIKHFTTLGVSLHGIDGFLDRTEELIAGKEYPFVHTSGTSRYVYEGYKKSTTGSPSGAILPGDPPKFTVGDFDYTVFFYYKEIAACIPGEAGCPGPESECSAPMPDQQLEASFMKPDAAAVIRADQRGNERFDLFQNKFVKQIGTCTFTVPVTKTYKLSWIDPATDTPMTSEQAVTQSIRVERNYAYWIIDQLSVYELDRAALQNYALPSGGVILNATGYTPPYYAAATAITHIKPPEIKVLALPPMNVNGQEVPVEDFTAAAEEAVGQVKVRNDQLDFMGSTIMSSDEALETGPTPGKIPEPGMIGQQVLFKPGLQIESTKANKSDAPSMGTLYYTVMSGAIKGGTDQQFPIYNINPVTVHTPVVNYAILPDEVNRSFDQRMQTDWSRKVLILDRPFTIHMPENGQHVNLPGYGDRDYRTYTKKKRVRFPFGVYHENGTYYPEGTWISIPVGTPSMTFKMPTWVNEGNYQIRTEEWAINGTETEPCEVNRNSSLTNYCAVQTFDVGVVGRLFNFRVWDIGDLRFEEVFRTSKGSKAHKSVAYYSGGRDENGQPTALEKEYQWQLPIRQGSHPTQRATVPHNGYPFLFDFKTIGNLWDKGEGIRIDPTFWFVPRSGGSASQVDLYYDASGARNKMILVGSAADKKTFTRFYQLADPFRNLNATELQQAAEYEYNHILSASDKSAITWEAFYKQYLKRQTRIGVGYDLEVLPYKSRTLIGPTKNIPSGVNATVALRSVQHWYGEYNLPIAPYILPKGTNIVTLANKYGGKLDGHEKEFLTKGYIIVNFAIYTVKNNDQQTEVLGYNAPNANMWAIEGQIKSDQNYRGQTFQFNAGDIILFESDFSVRNDFQGQGR